MCGIGGSTQANPAILAAMAARLGHRGPDGQGQWCGDGVGLVHTRLAVIDLSPGGAQPMASPCGRWTIAFNGEIYNYQDLRAQLEAAGERFSSSSDTEVLLRLMMRHGLDGLGRLAGMFAFALWDSQARELLLVRDRFGVKPLVWGRLPGGGIAFASEIHALRAQPGLNLDLDRDALSEYLACLYVPAPRTIHAGISKLPPGHWLKWQDGKVTSGRWWSPRYDGRRRVSVDEAAEEVLPLLRQAVAARLVADVEVGCFLSGGIDSSVIAALMAEERRRQGGPPPKTFTMTFAEAAYDERDAAAEVARHIGAAHTELPASSETVGFLDQMVTRFGEPFGNPTALLIRDLSGMARRHVTVALAGDGGDEVFAGYPRYDGGLLHARIAATVPAVMRRAASRGARLIPENSAGRHGWRRAREFLSSLGRSPADAYASWVEYFDPDERAELLHLGMLPASPIADLYRDAPSGLPLDAMQQTDLQSFLPGNLLAYGDAMSMDVALEMRLPLIDHRLVEAVAAIDPAARMAQGKKSILKAVARRLLPASIVDRPKLGFNPPMGVWLSSSLAPLLRERLVPQRMAELGLEWAPVARLLAEQATGRRDHSLKLWSLLVLDAWERGAKA
jgi:asparagine synthase (glutamine-hydrolysing)